MKYLLFLFFVLCFSNVKALTLDQTKYEAYGVKRAYVVCEYAFDLSAYNPTLKDFLLAAQSCPTDRVTIYEIKISKNLSGETVRSYSELLSGKKVTNFPTLDLKYIYTGAIGSNNKRVIENLKNEFIYNKSLNFNPIVCLFNSLTNMELRKKPKVIESGKS